MNVENLEKVRKEIEGLPTGEVYDELIKRVDSATKEVEELTKKIELLLNKTES